MVQGRSHIEATIRTIVTSREITRQKTLEEVLKNEYGIKISQASISRYLKDLHIKKDQTNNGKYVLDSERKRMAQEEELKRFLGSNCYPVNDDCMTVIVKTKPGFAEATNVKIKDAYPDVIVGAIAQNDLLIVFTRDEDSARFLSDLIDKSIVSNQRNKV